MLSESNNPGVTYFFKTNIFVVFIEADVCVNNSSFKWIKTKTDAPSVQGLTEP